MKEKNYFWMYRRDVLQNVRTYTFIIVVPHYSPINLIKAKSPDVTAGTFENIFEVFLQRLQVKLDTLR